MLSGGERIKMLNEKDNLLNLPENVEYLFDNVMMDIASFLCVLSCFKKKIGLDEFLFYYSLSLSDVDLKLENNSLVLGVKNAKYEVSSLYLYMKDHFQYIITYLSHNQLINLIVDKSKVSQSILIIIKPNGKNCIAKMQTEYYLNLIKRTKVVIKSAKYTRVNKDKVFKGEYYDTD